MNKRIAKTIALHAEFEYPNECCGLIALNSSGTPEYFPCENSAVTPSSNFRIAAEEWARVEDSGEILAVVHSHPDYPATPSAADRVLCEASGLPWYIQEVREGKSMELGMFCPSGFKAPLIGRPFHYGVLDCLQLVRDYYSRELGITLPAYEHEDDWWNNGQDYYRERLPKAGFYQVDDLRQGDVVLMQIRSPVPNHAGIYLETGKLQSEECFAQPGTILHHLYGQLSRRDNYGGYWSDVTVSYWRHKCQVNG